MTPEQEDRSLQNIETCRRVYRSAAERFAQHGVDIADIAIAAIYSAGDVAQIMNGTPAEAIKWMRQALDEMERTNGETITVRLQ